MLISTYLQKFMGVEYSMEFTKRLPYFPSSNKTINTEEVELPCLGDLRLRVEDAPIFYDDIHETSSLKHATEYYNRKQTLGIIKICVGLSNLSNKKLVHLLKLSYRRTNHCQS